MKCAECQDVLPEFALHSLAPHETEPISKHLEGCSDCRQYLEGVRESWAALADTLEPAAPPPHLKADLLARLHTKTGLSSEGPAYLSPEREPVNAATERGSVGSAWRWQSMLPYIAATLAGIAIGFWFAGSSTIDSNLVDRYHAQLAQAERTFAAPQMRLAALQQIEDLPEVHGYLMWDSLAGELHVYGFDLEAPAAGSIYRLWFVADDNTWIPVGDLTGGPNGLGTTIIDTPKLARPVSQVVITTEPAGGTAADDKTHGPIRLRGEFP